MSIRNDGERPRPTQVSYTSDTSRHESKVIMKVVTLKNISNVPVEGAAELTPPLIFQTAPQTFVNSG